MTSKEATARFSRVFVPIYKKDRQTGLVEHIATGLLFGTNSGKWLFTAAHVLIEHHVSNITLPGDPDFFDLAGAVLSSSELTPEANAKDPLDLAFVELGVSESDRLNRIGLDFFPLSVETVEATQLDLGTSMAYAGGFPLSCVVFDEENKISRARRYIYQNTLFSQEKLQKFGHNPSYRLGVRYERVHQPDGSTARPIHPKGMSGGPIWIDYEGHCRLAGIVTDYFGSTSLLLGTRLGPILHALRTHINSLAQNAEPRGGE